MGFPNKYEWGRNYVPNECLAHIWCSFLDYVAQEQVCRDIFYILL